MWDRIKLAPATIMIDVARSFVSNMPTVPPGVAKEGHTVMARKFTMELPSKHHCLLHGHLWFTSTVDKMARRTFRNPKHFLCSTCRTKLDDEVFVCRIFACHWEVCETCHYRLEGERIHLALRAWPRYDNGHFERFKRNDV